MARRTHSSRPTFCAASRPRTHTVCTPALTYGGMDALTLSPGLSHSSSTGLIEVKAGPSIRNFASVMAEPPVFVSFIVALRLMAAPTMAGVGLRRALVTTGARVSITVIVKLPWAVLPAASLALQVTMVAPCGNVDPEDG